MRSAAALLKLKGLAVGAGDNGRIAFVSAHLDFLEAAIVIAAAVMLTVVYRTFNRTVCKFCSHFDILLLIKCGIYFRIIFHLK